MVNWQDIHNDFGEKIYWSPDLTYQKLWEEWGFTREQAKLWIVADFTPRQFFQVIGWKNHGFAPQQAKEWIKVGLEPWEYITIFKTLVRFFNNLQLLSNLNNSKKRKLIMKKVVSFTAKAFNFFKFTGR